jgi:hypothetical protein
MTSTNERARLGLAMRNHGKQQESGLAVAVLAAVTASAVILTSNLAFASAELIRADGRFC